MDEKSAGQVCAWIAACVVIHNFLIYKCVAGDLAFDDIDILSHEEEPSEKAERFAGMYSSRSQRRGTLFSQFVLENGY